MGHKVHPKSFRLGTLIQWDSKWIATKRDLPAKLELDHKLRKFLKEKLKGSALDAVGIAMTPREVTITLLAGKPGMIIGRGGAGIEDLRKKIQKEFFKKDTAVRLNIQELQNSQLSAAVVLEQMAVDLEKRMPFRRVLKTVIEKVRGAGAQGVKVAVSGRLNGAEIARREWLGWGKLPLQTIRADVDYAQGEAHTIYGAIGIKVWIYKGERFTRKDKFVDDAKVKNYTK